MGFSSCSMWARHCGFQNLVHRLSSCGTRAPQQWDLPIPGITPASPALAGGVFTTEPPGHILDSSFPHMYLVREASIRRPGSWESSATVLAVPSKALGPLASISTSLGLLPPLRMPCCWTVAHQAPLSLGFLRPECWRGCHFLLYKIAFWRCFLLDCGFDEGRGIPSRAWEWVPVWHLENCPRRGVLSKRETLLGRAARVEGRRVRETERTSLPRGSQSQVLWSLG